MNEPFSGCHVHEAIFIRQKEIRRKVLYADILWVEAGGSYCDFHLTTGDTLTVVHTLTDIARKLPPTIFTRIHRSHLINVHHVDGIVGNAIYIGKRRLPVSAPYYEEAATCFDVLEESATLFKYKKRKKPQEP